MKKVFVYGMRLRGFSMGAQPSGVYEARDADKNRDGYWNFLVYENKLDDKVAKDYDLDYIGEEEI